MLVLLLLFSLLGCSDSPQPAAAPDPAMAATEPGNPSVTVIHNGIIHTMNETAPLAGAMAFDASGELVAVGPDIEVLGAFPEALLIDLQQRTVIPGLIDAHGHLHNYAGSLTQAQLAGTTNKAEIIERLQLQAATLGDDDWLLGRGWDQNDWPEQAFPDREDLDTYFPDRPVWLRRIDGHAAWANSAAISRVDRDLAGDWQVSGGLIHRDADGQPTGIFIDRAMGLIGSIVPEISDAVLMQALDLATADLVRQGLTGVHDPGLDLEAINRFERKIEAGNFPLRAYVMTDGAGATLEHYCATGPYEHPSKRLIVRATKLYGDGALGSRGAALLEDYSDEPGNRGLLFLQADEMQQQIDTVLACGFQVGVHAIGDRGNRVVLDALEQSMAQHPDNPGRHRVEHAQVVTPQDLQRFAKMEVIAAVQPTHATSDMYWAEERVGAQRILGAYAWRTLLDSGARLALGSDFPVEAVDPRLGLFAAVTRQDLELEPPGGWNPQERISRSEALRGFTLDAAFAAFMENEVGSLEPGKRADFVVLDRDYMTIPAEQIPQMEILETWVDGVRVFPR